MAEDRQPNPRAVLLLLAAQAAAFVVIGATLWHWSGRELVSFVTFSPREWLIGSVLGAGFVLGAAALFHRFPRAAERLVRMQGDTYRFLGPKLGWPMIVTIALAAGIGEEALLRGGVQTLLGDSLGAPLAIVISSAVFAALHLAKPLITALLFIIGLVFGAVYWLSDSLLAVMLGHVLYDLWALRYIHREFVRLGIVGHDCTPPAPLANAADAS